MSKSHKTISHDLQKIQGSEKQAMDQKFRDSLKEMQSVVKESLIADKTISGDINIEVPKVGEIGTVVQSIMEKL